MLDRRDLEPVFFAPFVSSLMRVEPGWIDYNGHLNMAYYNVLFDRAVDEAFELIGCGLDYVKSRKQTCFTAEVHVRYLRELHAGDPVRVTFQLLDYDAKRMHFFEQHFHADAGTGKTRVLTTRIAHILATGRARPSDILAVTFTNKAAREMKQRVGAMVGQIVEGMPWLGTFHSIGVKILRGHAELVGLKPDFTILDQDDQIRLMKQLLQAENIDEKQWPARVLAGLIDSWKKIGRASC